MGLFSDITSILFKRGHSTTANIIEASSRSNVNNAITLKAKDAVNMYPVLISESVMNIDQDLVFGIAGYLEQQYAIFTMLSTGLTPILNEDEAVRKYLSNFYTHESEQIEKDYITRLLEEDNGPTEPDDYIFVKDGIPDVTDKIDPKIGLSSKEMEELGFYEYAHEYDSSKNRTADEIDDDILQIETEIDTIGKQISRIEGENRQLEIEDVDLVDEANNLEAKRDTDITSSDKERMRFIYKRRTQIRDNISKNNREIDQLNAQMDALAAKKKPLYKEKSFLDSSAGRNYASAQIENIQKKNKATDPIIVRIKFQVPGLSEVVEIPIAVKAMIHPLSAAESKQIFTYLKEDRPLTTFVRIVTGELKFFKDFIFQIERAKADKELYKKLGRHPWFRQLMDRKQNKRARNLSQMSSDLKELSKGKSDTLPICTLVVTVDEVEKGYSNTIQNFLKQKDIIMNQMMLLCIAIVDPITNVVTFCFYGLKDPSIVRFETLTKEGKVGNSDKEMDFNKLALALIQKH